MLETPVEVLNALGKKGKFKNIHKISDKSNRNKFKYIEYFKIILKMGYLNII